GRAYAGLQGWGAQFLVGDTPMAAFLSTAQLPAVAFPYNASALPTDIMVRFNESDAAHYRLFNVRGVLTPQGFRAPEFLQPEAAMGRFQVLTAPGTGYFDVVDVTDARPVTRETFYDIVDPWLHGDGFAKARYVRLDFGPSELLPLAQPGQEPPGKVLSERGYEASVVVSRPAFVLFRMTWHPNWKVLVDGQPVKTAMLTPGFLGVPVASGNHTVICRYEPGNTKVLLAIVGVLLVVTLGGVECLRRAKA
ncbi:MAG: hypothetical protein JWP63_6810, partial [Candidatus Solibacter sp.]|nr:hypothetical protein [Candidatus Solibacter sp.]